MDLHQAVYSRRSVRDYTTDPVGKELLMRLIAAAVQAPSAMNEQPWSFSVVQNRETLAQISREAKAHILSTPLGGGPQEIIERLRDPTFDIFYNARVLILVSSVTQSPWATVNCSLAAQNLMLTARAEGLGTCWIGFAQTWLATPAGKAMLGLPPQYTPVAPIIVGWPVTAPPAVSRKEPDIRWIGP